MSTFPVINELRSFPELIVKERGGGTYYEKMKLPPRVKI